MDIVYCARAFKYSILHGNTGILLYCGPNKSVKLQTLIIGIPYENMYPQAKTNVVWLFCVSSVPRTWRSECPSFHASVAFFTRRWTKPTVHLRERCGLWFSISGLQYICFIMLFHGNQKFCIAQLQKRILRKCIFMNNKMICLMLLSRLEEGPSWTVSIGVLAFCCVK